MSDYPLDASELRTNFSYFLPIALRWNDLDVYRHLNNARYHTFFDTLIMHYLSVAGGFDLITGEVLPFTVENGCRFHRSFTFPDVVDAGLRVAHLGRSSVRYEMGLFRAGDAPVHATGHFVDVFVDRVSSRPQPIPEALRAHLARLLPTPPG